MYIKETTNNITIYSVSVMCKDCVYVSIYTLYIERDSVQLGLGKTIY